MEIKKRTRNWMKKMVVLVVVGWPQTFREKSAILGKSIDHENTSDLSCSQETRLIKIRGRVANGKVRSSNLTKNPLFLGLLFTHGIWIFKYFANQVVASSIPGKDNFFLDNSLRNYNIKLSKKAIKIKSVILKIKVNKLKNRQAYFRAEWAIGWQIAALFSGKLAAQSIFNEPRERIVSGEFRIWRWCFWSCQSSSQENSNGFDEKRFLEKIDKGLKLVLKGSSFNLFYK